jgi:hypothetical protein
VPGSTCILVEISPGASSAWQAGTTIENGLWMVSRTLKQGLAFRPQLTTTRLDLDRPLVRVHHKTGKNPSIFSIFAIPFFKQRNSFGRSRSIASSDDLGDSLSHATGKPVRESAERPIIVNVSCLEVRVLMIRREAFDCASRSAVPQGHSKPAEPSYFRLRKMGNPARQVEQKPNL